MQKYTDYNNFNEMKHYKDQRNDSPIKGKIKTWANKQKNVIEEELHDDSFPSSPSPNIKTNDVIYMVINKNYV